MNTIMEEITLVKNSDDDVFASEIMDYYFDMGQQNIALYYKGPFDEDILAKISGHLRKKYPDYPKTSNRLFSIFIELAQNISYYSAEKNHFDEESGKYGIGTILVKDTDSMISFTCGNLVDNQSVNELISKCEQINKLNYQELKELRKEIRNAPRKENHKGGNIGLVQVALKSQNPLYARATPVDDKNSFFLLTTIIEKNSGQDN